MLEILNEVSTINANDEIIKSNKEKKKNGSFVTYITVKGKRVYAKQFGKNAFFIPDKE